MPNQPSVQDLSYPNRVARLLKRRDFLRLRTGLKAVRPGVVIQAKTQTQPDAPARAGFTATKKIGNAVHRNRARRRLKEAVRLLFSEHTRVGMDYVFIARAQTLTRAWPDLLDDVKSALVSLAPQKPHSPDTGDQRPH